MGLSFGGLILFALLGTAVQSWLRVDIVPLGVSATGGWGMNSPWIGVRASWQAQALNLGFVGYAVMAASGHRAS